MCVLLEVANMYVYYNVADTVLCTDPSGCTTGPSVISAGIVGVPPA